MLGLALTFVVALGSAGPSAADEAPPAPKHETGAVGQTGIALLAGGAGLACTTAAGVTLLQALTTPDDNRNKPDHPELTEVTGFVTVAVGSLAAGLVIVGGALVIDDALTAPPAPAAPAH